MSTTDWFRTVGWVLWAVAVLAALYGWLVLERDPNALSGLLPWVTMAAGIGEASNVGKRATYKREAVDT